MLLWRMRDIVKERSSASQSRHYFESFNMIILIANHVHQSKLVSFIMTYIEYKSLVILLFLISLIYGIVSFYSKAAVQQCSSKKQK